MNIIFNWIIPILILSMSLSCGYQSRTGEYQKQDFSGSGLRSEKPGAEENNKYVANQEKELSKAQQLQNDNRLKTKDTKAADDQEPETEKKIYFGTCKLLVADIEEARSQVAAMAENSGGYVEAIYDTYIIIRVPKELFNEIFGNILQLGEVLNKSIETYDVSEYFQDLTTRLSVAERARERLYALLERTTDVEERLKILKEIRRLSEEIEKINLNLESIRKLIAFSRITVEFEARLENTVASDKSTIPFSWIGRLDPFYTSLGKLTGDISVDLGDDFAVFDKEKYFHAESPEGVKVRAGTTPNNPAGDAAFWQSALQYHLGKYYKSAEVLETGRVKAALFTSKDKKPFYYLTGVLVSKDLLYVVEVVFPGGETYRNKIESVKNALSKLEVKK